MADVLHRERTFLTTISPKSWNAAIATVLVLPPFQLNAFAASLHSVAYGMAQGTWCHMALSCCAWHMAHGHMVSCSYGSLWHALANVLADAILRQLHEVARRPNAHPLLHHQHQSLDADAWPDGLPHDVSHGVKATRRTLCRRAW